MELAALASAAVPGLAPTGVSTAPDDPADFESALLIDDSGKQWRVRAPRHTEAMLEWCSSTRRCRSEYDAPGASPSTTTRPASGSRRPTMCLIATDFPVPE